ncbi:MAG: FecR family protein [Odoribacter splanchnicus]
MEIDKIKKNALGKATGEETEQLKAWAGESAGRERFLKDAQAFYNGGEMPEEEVARRMDRIWKTMPVSRKRHRLLSRWAAVAACLVAALGVTWTMWQTRSEEGKSSGDGYPQTVQLLLSDGSRHELGAAVGPGEIPGFRRDSGGGLRQEPTVAAHAGTAVRYGEILVPRGGEYTLVLADGTKVMLNAETRLRFPEAFGDGERKVFLEGEAYFEVARDGKHPFTVAFEEGTVRVLGTQFNVKAYAGQETVATLVKGKVEVEAGPEAVVLQPGEQCRIVTGDTPALVVGEADLMVALAWKNGEFVFKDASLQQVLGELSRWYNVEIVCDAETFGETRVHIYMNRTQTLKKALDMLAKAWDIRYEKKGEKIIIGKR